jgi:hypothetical protein
MRRLGFAIGLIAGIALLVNPLYLDGMLPYPTEGDGFAIGGLYHAVVAGLGLLMVLGALAAAGADRTAADPVLVVCVAAVPLFVGYEAVVGAVVDPLETRILGYGHRKTFVVGVVAAAFALGAGATSDRSPSLALVPLLLGLGFVVVERRLPLTLPLDLLLVLFSADLLGVPFLGSLAFVGAALFGGGLGLAIDDPDGSLLKR